MQKRTYYFVLAALCVLLIPFLMMQFNVDGWDWHLFDYVVVGVLLASVGFALAAATNTQFPLKKRLIGVGVVGLLFILYVHLAVGIVDSWPLAGS